MNHNDNNTKHLNVQGHENMFYPKHTAQHRRLEDNLRKLNQYKEVGHNKMKIPAREQHATDPHNKLFQSRQVFTPYCQTDFTKSQCLNLGPLNAGSEAQPLDHFTSKHTYIGFSVQANLIIMLSLGSIETDHVISKLCYNEVTYYRHIAK